MKKALWIFATIGLFFAGDRVAGILLEKGVAKSQFRYSRMYTGAAQSDILLVGNSRGLIFYQPYIEELTKKKSFNLSYNGMPIDLATVIATDYFEKYQVPEKMIVDITMCDRLNAQLISGFNLYTPYSENLGQLILKNDKSGYRAAQLSHLYRYNSEIFQRAMFYLNKNDEDWLLDRVINDYLVSNVVQAEPYNIGFTEEMLSSLHELVSIAKGKGVEVHLVINPYYPAFASQIENLEALKEKAEAATGLKVHDYSVSVDERDGFADYQHLNKYGAQLYLDQLMKDGILN